MRIEPRPIVRTIASRARRALLCTAALTFALPGALSAQFIVRSWLDWRTIETPHFAFHYPAELEAWTRSIAIHAEAIDSIVGHEVGYAPSRKTEIVVDDPYETANGSAWPFINRPVINLWASPPSPREDIGEFRDWGSTILSHEFTHIAHLSRPSRNPFMRRLWQGLAVDLGPVALRAPRWAIEGYATYVEGRATGSGRPHGAWRAAFLRQWAIEGQLPRYEQLDQWGAYNGGEFAYLAGSAFLEWLVARRGESSLVDVWRRLTARQNRTFDDAFSGVFGASARALYGRFAAELTASAMEAQRRTATRGDTGAIVQRLALSTGDPAISWNGQRVALVSRTPNMPSRVIIWSTAPEPDTGRFHRDSTLLARDPEDVAARPIYPPPKKVLASLQSAGGAPYEGPRFFRDGRLLLWRYVARGDGSLTSDLYTWDAAHDAVRRVTHNASVRDADPSPDGRFAIGTRCTRGWCDLVRVDIASGAVALVDSGSPVKSFDRPRLSPNGRQVAVSVHLADGWQLRIIDLERGSFKDFTGAQGTNLYDAAWIDDGAISLVSEENNVPNIARLTLATGELRPMTNVSGAAVAPEPDHADGSLWFLELYSRGYDVRRIDARAAVLARNPAIDTTFGAAAPLPFHGARTFAENPVSLPRGFDLGRRLLRWVPSPAIDADGANAGIGLTSIDIVGRTEVIATGAYGDAASWRGASLAVNWRGTRPSFRARLFGATQSLSESRSDVPRAFVMDTRLFGGEVAIDGTRQYDTWAARYRLGGVLGTIRADSVRGVAASTATARDLAFAAGAIGWTQRHGRSTLSESISGDLASGHSMGTGFTRGLSTAALSTTGFTLVPLTASATYGRTTADAPPFEQFALGGGATPLLDEPVLGQRLLMPVLPSGIRVGPSAFTYRVSASLAQLDWYYWGGSTAAAGSRFTVWNRVVGAELSQSVPPIPVAGTPAARATIGAGESLDAPFRHRFRFYLALVLSP